MTSKKTVDKIAKCLKATPGVLYIPKGIEELMLALVDECVSIEVKSTASRYDRRLSFYQKMFENEALKLEEQISNIEMPNDNQWFYVGDCLPKPNSRVLFCLVTEDFSSHITSGEYMPDGVFKSDGGRVLKTSHWMYEPELPIFKRK